MNRTIRTNTAGRAPHQGMGQRNLVAMGTAAVLTVYAAGYAKTQTAADRFARETADRRPVASMADVPTTPGMASIAETASIAEMGSNAVVGIDTAVVSTSTALANTVVATATASTAPGTQEASRPKRLVTDSATPPVSATAIAAATASTTTTETSSPTTAATSATTDAPPLALAGAAVAAPPVPPTTAAAASNAAPTIAHPSSGATTPPRTVWRDGFFFGRGTSRHGDIEAMVEIKSGRIMSAVISQCLTRYSCSWIEALPGQVVTRQSPDVDYVSGATQSANAFYYAIVEALKQAK